MPSTHLCPLARSALLTLTLTLSGCASSQYQTIRGGPGLSRTVDLSGRNLSAEARVSTVILRGGPGAWKHDAWWDEYIVSLTNRASTPLTVEAAQLVSGSAKISAPGDDPWRLESESKTVSSHLRTNEALASATLLVTGAVLLETVTLGGVRAMNAADIAIDGLRNTDARNAATIAAEFQRRRLPLPLRLGPGETRTGSFFFPISPDPASLSLTCRTAQRTFEVAVDLKPIARIHLKNDPGTEPEPIREPLAPLGPLTSAR